MLYLRAVMTDRGPYRYFVHLAIWMALVTLYIFPVLRVNWSSVMGLRWTMVRYIGYGLINFHLFYLLVFYVLPLHAGKRHRRAILAVTGLLLFFFLVKYAVGRFLFPDEVLQGLIPLIGIKKTYYSFFTYFRITLQTGIAVAAVAYAYYIFLNWRSGDKESRRLQKEAHEAFRQYKRMQFSSTLLLRKLKALENMLHDENKRDGEGVAAILQLSELLRYMLYDKAAQQEKAPLERELQYYQVYLQLHNQLFPQQTVTIQTEGAPQGLYIEPLQLQAATEKLLQEQAVAAPVTLRLQIAPDKLALSLPPKKGSWQRLWAALKGYHAMHRFKTPLYAEAV